MCLNNNTMIKMLQTLVFLFTIHEICVCMNKLHPQEYVCRSDLILLANVLNFRRPKTGGYDVEVKINHQIETNHKIVAEAYKNSINLHLPECGNINEIQVNQQYVMNVYVNKTTNTIFIPKCEYFEPFLNLTEEELYGISGNYKRGCECRIKYCLKGCQKMRPMTCIWTGENWDLMKNITCLPLETTRCAWSTEGFETDKPINKRANYRILRSKMPYF